MTDIASGAAKALSACALLPILPLLISCAGTVVEMEGTICGEQVKFRMADAKDRSEFGLTVTCGEGGGITVTTAESSTSAVLAAQAAALSTLAGTLAREAAAGALP